MSGNVIQVSYQSAEADQWYHRYLYDADNRITDVYTSSVGWDDDPLGNLDMPSAVPLWHHDASYRYYLHGPLQRTEIGDLKVQGLDYAYTLQGWLKGVNGGQLNPQFDMGQDGIGHEDPPNNYVEGEFARDAFGFTLSYFEGDYTAIGTSAAAFEIAMGGTLETWRNDLWNGNIGSMTTALPTASNQTQGMGYLYDQLNRLKESKAAINFDSNTWGTETITDRYENIFSYDANGNILTQKRSDESGDMFDDLTYCYQVQEMQDNQWLLNRNRLYCVLDPNGIPMTGQIDDQGPFITDPGLINGSNNYVYDELGQLVADDQEEIEEIIWRVDGKISRVVREAASSRKSLKFIYDAMGNRIAKKVYSDNTFSSGSLELITYYLRDASGNVMSIYEETTGQLNLTEQHIYGSSRLGMRTLRTDMLTAPTPVHTGVKEIIRGERRYELTNHLGNVLVVCSDQLTATDGDSNNEIDFYAAEVVSYNDYYPFGAPMTDRTIGESRYGFNGQEIEFDVTESSTHYSAEFWMMDTRTARRYNLDPECPIELSTYSILAGNPIFNIDPLGNDTNVYIFHQRTAYGTYPENDPIQSEAQMEKIREEMQLIFEQNGINVNVKVISHDEAQRIKLDASDAILAIKGWQSPTEDEGNTSIYPWGETGHIDRTNTYISTINSTFDVADIKRHGGKMALEQIIAFKGAHEVIHQYVERARFYIYGPSFVPKNGGHINTDLNLMMDGSTWRKEIVTNPSQSRIQESKKIDPYFLNLVKIYISSFRKDSAKCPCDIENYKAIVHGGNK